MTRIDKLKTYLINVGDVELVTLKGHLLIEEVLNGLLEVHMEDVEAFRKLDLNFSRKVKLLSCLQKNFQKDFEQDVLELNRIRNKLAHKLDLSEMKRDLGIWACSLLGYSPKTINRKETYRNTVAKAFAFLIGKLSGLEEAKRLIKAEPVAGGDATRWRS